MKPKEILLIIEELGDITTSAAIVNYNLSKLIASNYKNVTILTLDSISNEIREDWLKNYGKLVLQPKKNLKPYQKGVLKFSKLKALFFRILGNDFYHYNRILNIRNYLKINSNKYDTILCLSGGLGFTPHQAIHSLKNSNIITVFHDPYPKSCYPKPYRKGKKYKDFFSRKNLQKSINASSSLIFPSKRLYEWYLRDYKIDKNKVKIIPHCVKEFDRINLINEDINNTILHTGTLLEPRDPSIFLNEFIESSTNFNVEFHGNINSKLAVLLSKFNDRNKILINSMRIPYQEALSRISKASFLLLIESNEEHNPFLPTKFVDYVRAEKPIIILSPIKSEVSRLVGENYPFITQQNNKKEIFDILNIRILNEQLLNESKQILRKLKVHFSKESILETYKEII